MDSLVQPRVEPGFHSAFIIHHSSFSPAPRPPFAPCAKPRPSAVSQPYNQTDACTDCSPGTDRIIPPALTGWPGARGASKETMPDCDSFFHLPRARGASPGFRAKRVAAIPRKSALAERGSILAAFWATAGPRFVRFSRHALLAALVFHRHQRRQPLVPTRAHRMAPGYRQTIGTPTPFSKLA
jgi:hypothetical protein